MNRHLPKQGGTQKCRTRGCLCNDVQPVGGAGHGLGWVLGAVDSKGSSCICKAASIEVAGASSLIPNTLVIVISGCRSSLFSNCFHSYTPHLSFVSFCVFTGALALWQENRTERNFLVKAPSWGQLGRAELIRLMCLKVHT